MKARRNIFKKIVLFGIFLARKEQCEKTIDTPIIQVNHGKTTSATVKPFQTKNNN